MLTYFKVVSRLLVLILNMVIRGIDFVVCRHCLSEISTKSDDPCTLESETTTFVMIWWWKVDLKRNYVELFILFGSDMTWLRQMEMSR